MQQGLDQISAESYHQSILTNMVMIQTFYVLILLQSYRSSRPEVFCKKGVLENHAKFTRKHLCQSLFFNKVAFLRPATLLKKRLWHRCFPVNFAKFPRTPFLREYLRWLLLDLKCLYFLNILKILNNGLFRLSLNGF